MYNPNQPVNPMQANQLPKPKQPTLVLPNGQVITDLDISREELEEILPELLVLPDYTGRIRAMAAVLFGPPGTGKSTLCSKIATILGVVRYKVASHIDGQKSEIEGSYLPLQGVWDFVPGPMLLAQGYRGQPGILCIDDAHLIGPGMMASLFTALDSGDGGHVLLPDGTMFKPDPKYAVILTMNGRPQEHLEEPVLDRIAMRFPVMRPSEEMFAALDPDIREYAESDYSGKHADQVATYRQWQSISALRPKVGIARALMIATGDKQKAKRIIVALSQDNPTLVSPEIIKEAIDSLPLIEASMASGAY